MSYAKHEIKSVLKASRVALEMALLTVAEVLPIASNRRLHKLATDMAMVRQRDGLAPGEFLTPKQRSDALRMLPKYWEFLQDVPLQSRRVRDGKNYGKAKRAPKQPHINVMPEGIVILSTPEQPPKRTYTADASCIADRTSNLLGKALVALMAMLVEIAALSTDDTSDDQPVFKARINRYRRACLDSSIACEVGNAHDTRACAGCPMAELSTKQFDYLLRWEDTQDTRQSNGFTRCTWGGIPSKFTLEQ